jgi:FSR family fosmidomycin resistance protein-like MFS transporter
LSKRVTSRPTLGGLSTGGYFIRGALLRFAFPVTFLLLLIELLDELVYGVQSAVLPSIRGDLGLDYAQVGLLLGLPGIIGTLIEPVIMLLGDTRLRKGLIVGGGLAFSLALLITAASQSFWAILLAFIMFYPASGAFVTLSQATLMDLNPGREPQMMARWTVAGAIGNLAGPLLLAGGFILGLGWRWSYASLAIVALGLALVTWSRRFPGRQSHPTPEGQPESSGAEFKGLLPNLWQALKNPRLMRWFILLTFSDLLLDVYLSYSALYFTDVVGLDAAQVSVMIGILMAVGLAGNLVLVPLLEHIPGRKLVRVSASITGVIYIAWLLLPFHWTKLGLAALLRFTAMGWYEVLQGEAFAALPGKSGTVMAINSLMSLLGGGLAWLIGWTAARAGLPAAMWLLLLGPLSLALFTPRGKLAA